MPHMLKFPQQDWARPHMVLGYLNAVLVNFKNVFNTTNTYK